MGPDPFVDHCLELLTPLGAVRSRRMFGGHGLYLDGSFIALIAFGRLYLKVNAQTKPDFEAAGCEPFVYEGKGKRVEMSYWTAPPDALESSAQMAPWARRAMQAALAAAAAKAVKPARKRAAGAAKPPPPATSGPTRH
ncbi:MAG: TfoX/Sxy family protein [Rubrivivax sp.]|nr:TfoX/Sxy family protein [Rubrivivax sp.]